MTLDNDKDLELRIAQGVAKTLSYWQQRAEEAEEKLDLLTLASQRVAEGLSIVEALAKRAEAAEAKLAEARKILFSYGEHNDGTAHPWWAVVKRNRMGAQAICAGPFFSRSRAADHAEARKHEYGKTIVWCFSGHRSQNYVELRKALEVAE